ncbi:MAG: hypothetical protein QG658_612 [Patescibacteria group bacterium]|nr:hypothetical protein [Patescibacteria group bacterium]
MKNSINQKSGFALIEGVIIIVVVSLIAGGIWFALNSNKKPTETTAPIAEAPKEQKLIWQQTETGWQATETPPDCPAQPIMKTPTDLTKVTSILYPGQKRGGNYKPHGGFRMDNSSNNAIAVEAPIDGFAVRGGQYLTNGEIQYTFDVMNNCGVMYRVGHLREIPNNLKKLTENWPAATEGDSRTQQIEPAMYIPQGEPLATSVGLTKTKNTFFDWGVYDYRAQNEASKSPSYQAAHQQDKELSWYAVCWFDWVPEADEKNIRALPAGDPASGKTSDYCR